MTRFAMARLALLYAVSVCAGALAMRAGLPLPWMIGPLLSTMALTLGGSLSLRVPNATRPIGQVIVATFVGAHFTPEALQSLLAHWPTLLGASLYTILVSILIARLQSRLFGTERVTSFLSVVPTSPVEASLLAEANRIDGAPVAMAQTARIVLVVTVIPLLMKFLGDAGTEPERIQGLRDVSTLLFTCLACGGGIILFRLLRLSNPFFLGPLLMAAVLSASGHPVFDLPPPVLALAQVVLGTWLGASMRRDLLADRRELIAAFLLSSGLLLVACLSGAWAVSQVLDVPAGTLVLGFAPGGVTEMALTAGILGQDVALVTAMHLTRIFVIMPNLSWIIRVSARVRARRG